LYNSILQHGRSGDPSRFEAECVNCAERVFVSLDSDNPKRTLTRMMEAHTRVSGHVMIQIGMVSIPIPKDQKIVRRIL
jgi:hypothetical protein